MRIIEIVKIYANSNQTSKRCPGHYDYSFMTFADAV